MKKLVVLCLIGMIAIGGTTACGSEKPVSQEQTQNVQQDEEDTKPVQSEAQEDTTVDTEKNTEMESEIKAETESETESVNADINETGEADYDIVGPWELASEKNDYDELKSWFGSALSTYGASMEIKQDGQISVYIGANGGSGTYQMDGNTLTAQITTDNEQTEETYLFEIVEEAGVNYLVMNYEDMKIWWEMQ